MSKTTDPFLEREIDEIKSKIAGYKKIIDNNKSSCFSYFLLIKNLKKLASKSDDQPCLEVALKVCNQGIDVFTKSSEEYKSFIAYRAELYQMLKQPGLAAKDIIESECLGLTGDKLYDFNIENIRKKLLEFKDIKQKVDLLKAQDFSNEKLEEVDSSQIDTFSDKPIDLLGLDNSDG